MGEAELAGQVTSEVLSRFGSDSVQGRAKYYGFMQEGMDTGRRDDLASGGEIRGAFCRSGGPSEEPYDCRVLGSGDFVEELWQDREQHSPEPRMRLPSLLEEVAAAFHVEVSSLCRANKSREISRARAVACYLATRELGYSGVAISRALAMTPAGVTLAAARGEMIIMEEPCRELLCKIRILKS